MKKFRALKPGDKILVLGSGGIKIGQAGEFDYAGSQAIKALTQKGFKVVLVNPNLATVQTDLTPSDHLKVYIQPLTLQVLSSLIFEEKPRGILLSFGGQTALNLALELDQAGVLAKYAVEPLGTPIKHIRITEDRIAFKRLLKRLGIQTPLSQTVKNLSSALKAAEKIGYPVMVRSSFSLGGKDSAKIISAEALKQQVKRLLDHSPSVLIETYLMGWKEFEYEVIRDRAGNAAVICSMENMDPMGIHTGDSIVVAPIQTLDDQQNQCLRDTALKIAHAVELIGEGNVQFALQPSTGRYCVIEMNARLSRSSALASKATGYPLAFIAAQLSLGDLLPEIRHPLNKKLSAFFEPALDYLTVKIPHWDFQKLSPQHRDIGSEMKSIGEVMGIGRSFPEAIQKAVRMLDLNQASLSDYRPSTDLSIPSDERLFALYQFLLSGGTIEKAHQITQIDPWFLGQIKIIADFEKANNPLSESAKIPFQKESIPLENQNAISWMRKAKQLGFSDATLAKWFGVNESILREKRKALGVLPVIKQIDTLAGESISSSNYLYFTYHGETNDVSALDQNPVLLLGSGPYHIGTSIEFDWCIVNAARSLKRLSKPVIIINANPETVSTDYDESDRLYFEELSLERLLDIAEWESLMGMIVSMGGQTPHNLASQLNQAGIPLLGTQAGSIDQAENREKFSQLLSQLGLKQAPWASVYSIENAAQSAHELGFPVIVRPSYVLSGTAMRRLNHQTELENYFHQTQTPFSEKKPVVLSKFIESAIEFELDGIASEGKMLAHVLIEHLEPAGIHSGDATLILPVQNLTNSIQNRALKIAQKLAKTLHIHGPFNVQFMKKEDEILVIECNLRASRSFPFVSKISQFSFIDLAIQLLILPSNAFEPFVFPSVHPQNGAFAVKISVFSYAPFKTLDPIAQIEMRSTGEVVGLGASLEEAFYQSWQASESMTFEGKNILLDADVKQLEAWEGLLTSLKKKGYSFCKASKMDSNPQKMDLAILISDSKNFDQNFQQRRDTIEHQIPLITHPALAFLLLRALDKRG